MSSHPQHGSVGRPQRFGFSSRPGFTLVEILVVITIIGILTAIAIPAINNAVRSARQTAIRMEINSLEQAVEKYREKYGDYPPDFSDVDVVTRHYRKIFPRISANDLALVTSGDIDRAEALVWALGGYSDDVQRPFTGAGGPLVWTGDGSNRYTDSGVTDADRQDLGNFQINNDRVNAFFDFDASRLNYTSPDSTATLAGTNRYLSTDDGDAFLTYAARTDGAPFV
ncbi:MAG: type II secretion system protein, partial [Novipirellula sp. JB048]